jgi:hypothetical protein
MDEVMGPERIASQPDTNLIECVRMILGDSREPLTLPRIRAALPAFFRHLTLEALAQALRRQEAAHVLFLYPKYRSTSDRFWDRPMRVHVAHLIRAALEAGPSSWSELRRRLPDYAKILAEAVLEEEVAQGRLHRHPPLGPRLGIRYGLRPADARPYVEQELTGLYRRLAQVGFSAAQVRRALADLTREEKTPDWNALFPWDRGAMTENAMADTLVEDDGLNQTLIPETMF